MDGFQVVNSVVQEDRLGRFDVVKAGDDVDKKKPDPMIYNMAQQLVNVPPEKCVVIEDSLVGLRAAKAAGMKCIITPTASTANAVLLCRFVSCPHNARLLFLISEAKRGPGCHWQRRLCVRVI